MSNEFVGRQYLVSIGKETTQGVSVPPTHGISRTDLTYQDRRDYDVAEEGNGSLSSATAARIVKEYSDGEVGGHVKAESIGLMLLATLGKDTPTQVGSDPVYSHLFEVDEVNIHPSLSVDIKNPLEHRRYAGAMVSGLKLNAEIGGYFEYALTLLGKRGEDVTGTPSINQESDFIARDVEIYVGDDLSTIESTTSLCVESLELDIQKDVEQIMCMNSLNPLTSVMKMISAEANLSIRFRDLVMKNYYLNGTEKAVRIKVVDTQTTLTGGSNPSITIDFPRVVFTERDEDRGLNEIVSQDLKMVALYDIPSASMMKVTVVNSTPTY